MNFPDLPWHHSLGTLSRIHIWSLLSFQSLCQSLGEGEQISTKRWTTLYLIMPKTVYLSDFYWACVQSGQLPKSETIVHATCLLQPSESSYWNIESRGNPEIVMDLEITMCHTWFVMTDAGPDIGEDDIHAHCVLGQIWHNRFVLQRKKEYSKMETCTLKITWQVSGGTTGFLSVSLRPWLLLRDAVHKPSSKNQQGN